MAKKHNNYEQSESAEKPVAVSKKGRHTADGREILDPKPMAVPLGFSRPPTLAEQVRRLVGHYKTIEDAGYESIEDADDFDIPEDDAYFNSPYELVQDEQFGEVTQEAYREIVNARKEFDEKVVKARKQKSVKKSRQKADIEDQEERHESQRSNKHNSKSDRQSRLDDDEEE